MKLTAMKLPGLKRPKTEPSGDEPTSVLPSRVDWLRPSPQFFLGRHLGFHIDDAQVQMAAARHFGTSVTLLDIQRIDLSDIGDDNLPARDLKVRTAINDFVRKNGGKNPVVSLTVSGRETALRTSVMPDMGRRQIAAAVTFDAKRQLPFPVRECLFDFRPIQRITAGRDRKVKIAVMAATKRLIESTLKPLDDLEIDTAFLYHSQDVTGQLLTSLPDFKDNAGYALINIRRQGSEIAYYRGTTLEFVHLISIGSSFLGDRTDHTTFEYFAESLASEIQNSLDYYSGQYSTNFSNQVYLYGELSFSDELLSLLSERLGLSFLRFPTERLGFVQKPDARWHADLPVCLPAVAAATNRVRLANLLPGERKQKRNIRVVHRMGIAALLVLTGLLAAQWMASNASLRTAQERQIYLQQQVETFRASESFKTYNHLKRSIARSQAFINKAKDSPSYLNLNLKELSNLTPANVKLDVLDYASDVTGKNLHLTGEVLTERVPPELTLAEFVENLESSPFYDQVEISRNKKRRTETGFALEFVISMRGVI